MHFKYISLPEAGCFEQNVREIQRDTARLSQDWIVLGSDFQF